MKKLITAFIAGAMAIGGLAGCNKDTALFKKVDITISDNLEVVRLALQFTDKIQSDLSATFAIKEYGAAFMHPYTGAQPFEVGFDLNTSIVNEQDYVNLEPTTVFPNGVPMGIPYAVVEVSGGKPISDKFDMFGYVDVLHQSWLGAAGIFSFLQDKYFPEGLAISQVFTRDDGGMPAVLGSVFGPVKKPDGSLARAGGVALLANVRFLVEKSGPGNHMVNGGKAIQLSFEPEPHVILSGPSADQYEGRYDRLLRLRDRFIERMNSR